MRATMHYIANQTKAIKNWESHWTYNLLYDLLFHQNKIVCLQEESRSSVGNKVEEIPLYDEDLDTRAKSKRQFRGGNQSSSSKLRKLYNNWYNGRNDWSRKIAKVQGRIRFKKLNQNSS